MRLELKDPQHVPLLRAILAARRKEISRLRAELAVVQAQAASMSTALEAGFYGLFESIQGMNEGKCGGCGSEKGDHDEECNLVKVEALVAFMNAALSSDAGESLLEALRKAREALEAWQYQHHVEEGLRRDLQTDDAIAAIDAVLLPGAKP